MAEGDEEAVTVSARLPARLSRRLERACKPEGAPNKSEAIINGLAAILPVIEEENRQRREAKKGKANVG